MTKRKFKFQGIPAKKDPVTHEQNVEVTEISILDPATGDTVILEKDKQFLTDSPLLIKALQERNDVEEVTPEPEEKPKSHGKS